MMGRAIFCGPPRFRVVRRATGLHVFWCGPPAVYCAVMVVIWPTGSSLDPMSTSFPKDVAGHPRDDAHNQKRPRPCGGVFFVRGVHGWMGQRFRALKWSRFACEKPMFFMWMSSQLAVMFHHALVRAAHLSDLCGVLLSAKRLTSRLALRGRGSGREGWRSAAPFLRSVVSRGGIPSNSRV